MIYEILQAKKVILESVDSHSGAVGADITTVVAVGGPPLGANLSMSATKKTLVDYTVPDNKVRAFGFRAIHAQYDSTGEFFSFRHVEKAIQAQCGELFSFIHAEEAIHAQCDSTGEFFSFRHVEEASVLPTVRGEHKSENIDPRLDLGGLFLKPPADMHDDNGDDIECLEIVASNLAEEPDK